MKNTVSSYRRTLALVSALATLFAFDLTALQVAAQPRPAPPAAQRTPGGADAAAPATPKANALVTALAAQPGGLTPEELARESLRTRASLRAKQADLRAASARVDQALVNFFPRVTVAATYTRLSEVPAFDLSQFIPGAAATPPIVDSYALTASVAVPISDYVLRISQGYAAASHAESAKKLEAEAEALQVAADAKINFYNWVKVKGQVVVTEEAVAQAKAHVADARRTFEVGLSSRADVLRLEAQVASAEQVVSEAQAGLALADEQIRIALGATSDKPLAVGVDVMGASAPVPVQTASLQSLQQEALQKRLEIRALDETLYSLKNAEGITRAGYLPRIDAFADLTYANPNQRYFPQEEKFETTWDAGVRASWVLNDFFTTLGATAESNAQTSAVEAQKAAIRDGLRLEVTSAYADVNKAASTIDTAERQLTAAEESMRVRNELFRAGRATATDVVDSENEVTRARLQQLNARVGALVAKTRFEHALGRDVKSAK